MPCLIMWWCRQSARRFALPPIGFSLQVFAVATRAVLGVNDFALHHDGCVFWLEHERAVSAVRKQELIAQETTPYDDGP